MRLTVVPLGVVLVWVSAVPGYAATGDIVRVPNFFGMESAGGAINASGQVTGYGKTPAGLHAFLYTPGAGGGTMADLGVLAGVNSQATSINALGQVTGNSDTNFQASLGMARHAFLYTGTPGLDGQMIDLGTLGGEHSYGSAINASGQVVGTSNTQGNAATHAFVYLGTPGSDGHMVDLGTLGGSYSGARGINAAGQIAGTSAITDDAADHAFLYTGTAGVDGHMMDLGTLGGSYSDANAINAAGQVAGTSDISGDTAQHAFLYTGVPGAGGQMFDLGDLGGSESYAEGINAFGQVVGSSFTPEIRHAFLYTGTPGVDGHMIDLDAWLDETNPAEGASWTLYEAHAITDTGLIVGQGYYFNDAPGDGMCTFVLDAGALVPVPEPGTLGMVVVMGVVLLGRRGGVKR